MDTDVVLLGMLAFFVGFAILGWIVAGVPAYVVGRRTAVVHSGEALIPIVGPYIVILHSIRRSGWLCLLSLPPYVGVVFYIWLVCVVPGDHRRTRWWILPFLIPLVNVVAFYVYAFTLPQSDERSPAFATP